VGDLVALRGELMVLGGNFRRRVYKRVDELLHLGVILSSSGMASLTRWDP